MIETFWHGIEKVPRDANWARRYRAASLLGTLVLFVGCLGPRPGERLSRRGDEIMICGQLFHTGAPVVLWTDPGGYDAYRVDRRFAPLAQADWETSKSKDLKTPNRYNLRSAGLAEDEIEKVRGGGWELAMLADHVDQFVLHYDVCGTSRQCFKVLHDLRGLSVHFMLDIDGTIYQTLDVKERAWHATTSNDRSVGIEIANMGAYADDEKNPLDQWYAKGADGRTRITIPERLGDGGIRTAGFVGRPIRGDPVSGEVQGRTLKQYDLTQEQYDSLIKLTAALCRVLPKIKPDYPRDAGGALLTHKLPDDDLKVYQGVLAHFHIQTNKIDPGPAFQWDRLIDGVRRLIKR